MVRGHRNLVVKRISEPPKGPPASSGNGNGNASGNGKPDPAAHPSPSPDLSPLNPSPSLSPIPPSNPGPSPSPSSSGSNSTPLNSSPSPGSSSHNLNSSPILLSSGSSLIPSTSNPVPSFSAVPSSSATLLPDSCLGCVITMDNLNNSSLHYNGVWFLNNISGTTTRSTTAPNSSVAFAFNGSSVAVYGTVPKSNATTKPPTAAYTVDSDPPFVTTEPSADSDIPNQMLYRSSELSSKEHVINITIESADAPYIIQYIFVFPPNSTQNTSSSSPTSTPWKEPESSSDELADIQETTKILGGTLGSFVVFAMILATIIIIRRRRLGHAKGSLTASWAPSFSASSRGLTSRVSDPFTTTASIMRSNASSVSYIEHDQSQQTGLFKFP